MKKRILILSGGISKERLISLDTGMQVAKELKKNGYETKICEPDKNLEKKSINLSQKLFLVHYMVSLERMAISKLFLNNIRYPILTQGLSLPRLRWIKKFQKKFL